MNFRSLLVSKTGSVLVFLASALVAWLLSWAAAKLPSLHLESLVAAVGGQDVLVFLLLGVIREGIAWAVRHWAATNIQAVTVIQEAINEQLGKGTLKADGLLQQQTGLALNRLMPKIDLPIEKIPVAKKSDGLILGFFLLLLVLLPVLPGCAIETPKAYLSVPGTPLKVYGYAGGGITLDEAAQ